MEMMPTLLPTIFFTWRKLDLSESISISVQVGLISANFITLFEYNVKKCQEMFMKISLASWDVSLDTVVTLSLNFLRDSGVSLPVKSINTEKT